MKKSTWWVVGIIVVVVIILVASGSSRSDKNGAIKLGFIAPLTGDAAAYGQTEKNATVMALDKIKQEDQFKNREINVIYEDGKCSGKEAVTVAQKLINIDSVKFILGGACGAETLGVAPLAEKSQVILFSAFSSVPAITDAGDFVFRNGPNDNDAAKSDAKVLAKFKKIAIITENTDYSQGLRKALSSLLTAEGVSIVADEVYSGDTKDFRTILTKIKQSSSDVVYYNAGTSPSAAGLMLNQARDLGIKQPAYFNFFMGNDETIKIAGKNAEGVIFSDAIGLTNQGKSLLSDYKARFGSNPANDYEFGAAYDRVFIILNAIDKVGYNPVKVRDYLYSMSDYDGAIGKYHFDKNGDITMIGYISYIIKDGKKTPYTE